MSDGQHVDSCLLRAPSCIVVVFPGYYLTLKDKTVCVIDRLKLVKFAWNSSDVYIPNKEQVLVDLLFGLLINKKKYVCFLVQSENVISF